MPSELGAFPTFEIWQEGFLQRRKAGYSPLSKVTTFRFVVDVYTSFEGDKKLVQRKFRELQQTCATALDADKTLDGTCEDARLTEGQAELLDTKNNPMLHVALVIEADWPGIW